MSIKTVIKMGHPLLAQVAPQVTDTPQYDLDTLIQDMKDTMQANNGAGIAAPQIGISLQVMMIGFEKTNPRYPNEKPTPITAWINPSITPATTEEDVYWEACLSVPGLRGLVSRPTAIRYCAYTLEGKKIEGFADGFTARVIQHEVDHLNGILYPKRIQDLRYFGFEDSLPNSDL